MNFQKFIYDFLKFNDFSANFHDISACAMVLKLGAVGFLCDLHEVMGSLRDVLCYLHYI